MPDKFAVKKSYRNGCVALRFSVTARGYDSLKVEGGCDLSIPLARELAKALIDAANKEEARIATKEAAEERRQKWREREIAAGRMKTIGAAKFFRK